MYAQINNISTYTLKYAITILLITYHFCWFLVNSWWVWYSV